MGSPKTEPQNSTMNPSTPGADAWLKKLENSTLTQQEKIEATKVLIKLLKMREKNKALFDKLGLDRNGHPVIVNF